MHPGLALPLLVAASAAALGTLHAALLRAGAGAAFWLEAAAAVVLVAFLWGAGALGQGAGGAALRRLTADARPASPRGRKGSR